MRFNIFDAESDIEQAKMILEEVIEGLERSSDEVEKGQDCVEVIEQFGMSDSEELHAVLDMNLEVLKAIFPDQDWDDFDDIEQAVITLQTMVNSGFAGFDLYQ